MSAEKPASKDSRPSNDGFESITVFIHGVGNAKKQKMLEHARRGFQDNYHRGRSSIENVRNGKSSLKDGDNGLVVAIEEGPKHLIYPFCWADYSVRASKVLKAVMLAVGLVIILSIIGGLTWEFRQDVRDWVKAHWILAILFGGFLWLVFYGLTDSEEKAGRYLKFAWFGPPIFLLAAALIELLSNWIIGVALVIFFIWPVYFLGMSLLASLWRWRVAISAFAIALVCIGSSLAMSVIVMAKKVEYKAAQVLPKKRESEGLQSFSGRLHDPRYDFRLNYDFKGADEIWTVEELESIFAFDRSEEDVEKSSEEDIEGSSEEGIDERSSIDANDEGESDPWSPCDNSEKEEFPHSEDSEVDSELNLHTFEDNALSDPSLGFGVSSTRFWASELQFYSFEPRFVDKEYQDLLDESRKRELDRELEQKEREIEEEVERWGRDLLFGSIWFWIALIALVLPLWLFGWILDLLIDVLRWVGHESFRREILAELMQEVSSIRKNYPCERITLVGHSLGSVIAAEAAARISAKELQLVTMGSPLDYLHRIFPRAVESPHSFCVRAEKNGMKSWLNVWRNSDRVGKALTVESNLFVQTDAGKGGHANYWKDKKVWKVVDKFILENEKPVAPSISPNGQFMQAFVYAITWIGAIGIGISAVLIWLRAG